eukprot:12418100-Karenia_brevis.AAC.1
MMLRIMTTMHGGDGAVIVIMIGAATGMTNGPGNGPQRNLPLQNLRQQLPPLAPVPQAFRPHLLLRRVLP